MGHLLLVANQSLFNQQVKNTFYFGGGDATMANAQTLVDALADCWLDNLVTALVDNWFFLSCTVYDKEIAGVPGIDFVPTGGAFAGSAAAEPLPNQIALLVGFKCQTSPPNKNRKYMAGLFNGQVVNGVFTPATLAVFQAFGDQVIDIPTATGLGVAFEVVSLDVDGTVVGGNPLTSAFTRSIPATQRRRRIGVGA